MAGALFSLSTSNLRRLSTSPPAYNRPNVIAGVTQNLSYWESIHSDIDSHLKKAIPIREPISVFEPMHHLTFSAPKTTASALCVAACELVGGNREDAIVAASAIHLIHAAIYTHELLMSRNKTRMSEFEPEIPHMFGPNIELLTGDGIMPFGFEILANSIDPTSSNSEKILRVIIEITQAVGAQSMVTTDGDGQEDDDVDVDRSSGRRLYGCGAACGAILGGGNEDEIERSKRFGVYVGKIEGLLREIDKNEGGNMQLVEKWRALARKELEYFDSRKIEKISTIVLD